MFDHERLGRVFGIATVDVLGTLLIAWVSAYGLGVWFKLKGDKLHMFVFLGIVLAFIFGEMVHLALKIPTAFV